MPQYELSFQDYWRIIRRRKAVIILAFFAVLISTIAYLNFQTPLYRAYATIKIEQRKTLVGALMDYIAWSPKDPMFTEAQLIESWFVVEKVVRNLNLAPQDASQEEFNEVVRNTQEAITTETISDTNIIKIMVVSDEAWKAAAIANEVASVYVGYDLERKIKQAKQVREFIENQLATVEEKLKSSEERLKEIREKGAVTGIAASLETRLVNLKAELSEFLLRATEKHPKAEELQEQIHGIEAELKNLPENELEYARLSRDVNVNVTLYKNLREKFEEARIAEAEQIGDVNIVDYASEPKSPFSPKKKVGGALGAIVGLMLGFVLAFVVEALDTSIGTIEDVESLLKIPVVGVIPHVKLEEQKTFNWWKVGPFAPKHTKIEEARVRLIVHDRPKSPIAEAYRTLRTNLRLAEPGKKFILVTSAGPKEGKTTIMVNLGLTSAQMGNKTLLVSTDLRRPALYQTFGINREPGLHEILSNTISWEKAIKSISDLLIGKMGFEEVMKAPGLDNLHILESGHIPLNPSELLASKEMARLIEQLKTNFDVVLFDSPPTLPITDALILAPKLDGVVIIYEIGRTARGALLRAKNQLESAGAKILGIVLNHIRPETEMYPTYYPRYYHYKYYGSEKKEERKGGQPEESPEDEG